MSNEIPATPLRLQFHILTVMPPHNVNRDEDGRPKTAQYGGWTRGRISSQSKKRWMRYALIDDAARAVRTREAGIYACQRLLQAGASPVLASWAALAVNHALGGGGDPPKLDDARKKVGSEGKRRKVQNADEGESFDIRALRSEQGLVVSRRERAALDAWIDRLANAIADASTGGEAAVEGAVDEIAKTGFLSRQAIDLDIALFGRMVASNPEVNTEAAASVGHMMTTHAFATEGDYFSAGEELRILPETGAAITSYAFYGSGVYYQHAVLDVGHLARTLHEEGEYEKQAMRDLVVQGVRVMLDGLTKVQPRGKRNSFASDTMASFALVEAGSGSPFNLSLAFLDPVRAGGQGDLLTVSIERLRKFHAEARAAYSLTDDVCAFAGPGAPRAGNAPPAGEGGVTEAWTLAALHAFAEQRVAAWWAGT